MDQFLDIICNFKPGMHLVLKIAFVREVGMCVCPPQAIKNHSREMKLE